MMVYSKALPKIPEAYTVLSRQQLKGTREAWTDADCAGQNNNNTCTGAIICPCGVACLRADLLGMCN